MNSKLYRAQEDRFLQPVENSMAMQKHKRQRDFSRIKSGPSFVKLSSSLNLEHEISSIDVLHDKEQTILNTKQTHTG